MFLPVALRDSGLCCSIREKISAKHCLQAAHAGFGADWEAPEVLLPYMAQSLTAPTLNGGLEPSPSHVPALKQVVYRRSSRFRLHEWHVLGSELGRVTGDLQNGRKRNWSV